MKKYTKKEKINEVVLSGWNNYENEYSLNNYYITEIVKNLFKRKKITILSKEKNINKKLIYRIADIKNISFEKDKKNILLSNLGYNFFRLVKSFNRQYNVITPEDPNLSWLKRLFLKYFFNVNFIKFTYKISSTSKILKPSVSIKYNNKIVENLLKKRFDQEINNLVNLKLKALAIDNLFKKINIFLVVSHNVRGDNGYYLEKANNLNINSICVPHGTISKNFNNYDKIYKEIISDSIIFDKTKFIAAQSKIANQFLKKKNLIKKIINCGNFIFLRSKKFFLKKKFYLL